MKKTSVLLVCTLVLLAHIPTAAAMRGSSDSKSQPLIGTIRARVPAGDFILHATVPVPLQAFVRQACPYVVLDPDGTELPTQWERVASTREHLIIELRAAVTNRWQGMQTFSVVPGDPAYDLNNFLPGPFLLTSFSGKIEVEIEDQDGDLHRVSLSGTRGVRFHRLGPVTITAQRHVTTQFGSFHVWLTANAGMTGVELILDWHNGQLPAQPDVFFRSLRLDLPPGWDWVPLLPDPTVDAANGYLVTPDQHVLPQRMERSFRLALCPVGTTPDLSLPGWGVGDWSRGGYLAQDATLPDLSHTKIDLAPNKAADFDLLARVAPTNPGNTPVSPLWPAQGVLYGGMTSGIEIDQYPAIPVAVSGQVEGLLSLYVEQLRYASRQMGCIYDAAGAPIEMDEYLKPNGGTPWNMFNNTFLGQPVQDAPFFFSQTGPGIGAATYDPSTFDPIDYQHFIRRTKANEALVWLDNDPLARLYVLMDAELGRMCFFEGPNGRLQVPVSPGLGTQMGRAESWVADVMAHAYAISDAAYRARTQAWFETFTAALRQAQMPNGLFSARMDGKVAQNPPYGDGKTAFYWAHSSNEQVFHMTALRAIHATVGIDCADIMRGVAFGLWNFAWKQGGSGVLDRYPAGPVGGARFATRAQIPAGLTGTIANNDFHVGTALGHGFEAGQQMFFATLAYTQTSTLTAAKAVLEGRGIVNIQNWGNSLASLQALLGP